jgi:glycosyltransferase involved in cell wall biosynthesis
MDVFCHPSRSEGSPTAVLEAAALERPLIVSTATNVGQIVEVRGCGLHLKQTTPKTIEKALNDFSDLYHQEKHLQMGKCAYKMVKEEFNWNSVAKKLVNIYEESTNIKR